MHNLQYLQTSISVRNRRMTFSYLEMCEHVPNGPGQVWATHWPSGVLLLGETEDPKNYPVASPCLTMCGSLLHAAARKCGTPVIITRT